MSIQNEVALLLESKASLEQELSKKTDENNSDEVINKVNARVIGSWLSLPDSSDNVVTCKITMIYSSTGKYVFADPRGIRKADFTKAQIVELMLEDKVNIVR